MKNLLAIFTIFSLTLNSNIYLDNINSDNYPEITAEIYVSDANNARIEPGIDDIRVFEGINPAEIYSLECEDQSLNSKKNLLLVIESTASISSAEVKLIEDILDASIKLLDHGGKIGITTFNNYSFVLSEFTDDEEKLKNSLDFLLPNGIGTLNTAFLSETANSIEIADNGDAEILFITDGDIAGNTTAILQSADQAGVQINSLILGNVSNAPLDQLAGLTEAYIYENVTDRNFENVIGAVFSRLYYRNPCKISWRSGYCNSPAVANIVHIPTQTNFDFGYEFPEDAINLFLSPSEVLKFPFFEAGDEIISEINLRAINTDFEIIEIEHNCNYLEITNFPTGILPKERTHKIDFKVTPPDINYRICEVTIKTTECEDLKFFIETGRKEEGILTEQLEIIDPNGGEIYFPGEQMEVYWENTNPLDTFDIDISNDGGNSWNFIENVRSGNTALISLPFETGNNYKVRVSQYSGNEFLNGVYYLDLGGDPAKEIAWNKDASLLATYTAGNQVDIWEPAQEEKIGIAGNSIINAFGLQWGNVTDNLAIINDFGSKDLVILDGTLQNVPIKLNGNGYDLNCLSWSADDSQLAVGSTGGDILIYEPEENNPVEILNDVVTNSIDEIALHPTKNWIYLLDGIGNLNLYDIDDQELNLLRNIPNAEEYMQISSGGDSIFLASKTEGVFLITITEINDLISSDVIFRDDNEQFKAIDWSENKSSIIKSNDELIQVIDQNTGDTTYTFIGHSNTLTTIKVRNNWVASYSGEQLLQVWNISEEHSPFIFQRDESDSDFRIVPVRIQTFDIDLGDICKDFTKDTIVESAYFNSSLKEVTIEDIYITNDPDNNFSRPLETQKIINVNDYGDIRILTSPTIPGEIEAEYIIQANNEIFRGKINANVIEAKFSPSREILDLGKINLGESRTISFDIVENVSSNAGIIDSAKIFFPEKIFDLPSGVVSSGEILEYEGVFSFDVLGPKTGLTRVFTRDNCTPIQIPVKVDVVAPNPILTGSNQLEILNCKSKNKDTVFIRNTGEGSLVIESVTSNNPSVTATELDKITEAGTVARIELEYLLDEPKIDSVDIFVLSNTKEDFTKSSIYRIFFEKIDTRFETNKSEFLFVTPNNSQELIIENIGVRRIDLEFPESEFFNFDSKPESIFPGEEITVNITALEIDRPIPERTESTTINLSGFCDDRKIVINSDFRNRLPVINTFENIEFDNLICTDNPKDTIITIENIGNAELELRNIRLEGNEASSFEISNSEDITLEPSESIEIKLTFNPNGKFSNSAVFVSETNSTQNDGELRIPISINHLISEFNFDNSEIIIDELEFDTQQSFQIDVENLGNLPASVSPSITNPNFLIDSISNLPAAPGENSIIYLRFLGGEIDETYIADLIFSDDCGNDYSKRFEINVVGTRLFEISVGNFYGVPGDIINVPLIVSNPSNSKLPDDGSYSATLSFNSTILHSSKSFTGIESGKRWVEISGDLLSELSGDNLSSADLLVTLGNAESTELEINAEFNNANAYKFSSSNGNFNYASEYLQENPGFVDGNLRINFQGPNPNPAQGDFKISFNMIEKGSCSLKIIDLSGRVIRSLIDDEISTGYYEINLNSLEFSSGYYYLRFTTPTYSKLVPFTVAN